MCPQSHEREFPFSEILTNPVETRVRTKRCRHPGIVTLVFLFLSLSCLPPSALSTALGFLGLLLQSTSHLKTSDFPPSFHKVLSTHIPPPVFALRPRQLNNSYSSESHFHQSSQLINLSLIYHFIWDLLQMKYPILFFSESHLIRNGCHLKDQSQVPT